MNRFYINQWLGIPLAELDRLSSRQLPGPDLYEAFYQALFVRFGSWNDLPPEWREQKDALAQVVDSWIAPGWRVLSLGCGLGWVERRLLEWRGDSIRLEVSDWSPTALRWLLPLLDQDAAHIGPGLARIPVQPPYDLIYANFFDYCLDEPAWRGVIAQMVCRLRPGGAFLVVTNTLPPSLTLTGRAFNLAKAWAKAALERVGRYDRGQLWGWQRTPGDYRRGLAAAGLTGIGDGWVDYGQRRLYWVAGLRPSDDLPEGAQ